MSPLFKPRSEILPELVRRPRSFLVTNVIPLVLLILLNGSFIWILNSQFDQEMLWRWISLMVISCLLLGGGLFFIRKTRKKGGAFPVHFSFIWLSGIVGYLTLVTYLHEELIPNAESLWILDSLRFLGIQFTLLMPAVFHHALQLACIPYSFKKGNDLLISVIASVALPVLVYVVVVLLGDWSFFGGVFFLMFCGITLFVMMCILRAIALLYLKTSGSMAGETFLILFLGLALPLGGLLLNRKIPFPADYQQSTVYVLTVLNALVLLLSLRGLASRLPLVVWFLQWTFLPFTLYFFLVFLPWLPLSLLAMIAAGSGFLIMAPTGLMLLHGMRIVQTRREISVEISRSVLIGAAVVGFLILPGAFVGKALQDRATLNHAIAYVFEPEFENNTGYDGNLMVLKRSLKHLGEHYEGRYVPYLSDLYDALVFQGLVLPQSKMDILYQTFFGMEAPEFEIGEWNFMSTSSRRNSRNPRNRPPSIHGVLEDVDWDVSHRDGILEATAILTLHNPTSTQTEFVQNITLPPGVWVSGYWLDVEGVRKPGRITERKTATWVYKTIRDVTRRDPGLLVYDGLDGLELRVFPLAAGETRTTAISFTAIARPDLVLSVGESSLPLPDEVEVPTPIQGTYSLSVPSDLLGSFQPVERRPVIYLMVDRSVNRPENAVAAMKDALEPVVNKWGDRIAGCRVVSVNHNVQFSADPISWPLELDAVLPEVKREGGMLLEHAVVRMVQDHQQLMNKDPQWATTFPLPVWVLGDGKIVHTDLPLAHWVQEVPEWEMVAKDSRLPFKVKSKPAAVWLLKTGDWVHAKAVGISQMDLWLGEAVEQIEVYMPESGQFKVATTDLTFSEAYDGFSRTWYAYRSRLEKRDLSLRTVVSLSRETGVLLPVTAYIVLENAAQEKMMKLKEQQKLMGQDSLDFMDTPEPELVLMVSVALLLALGHLRSKKKRALVV